MPPEIPLGHNWTYVLVYYLIHVYHQSNYNKCDDLGILTSDTRGIRGVGSRPHPMPRTCYLSIPTPASRV